MINEVNRLCANTVLYPLNLLLFTFVCAMVLAPWRNPIIFIVCLVILLIVYLFLFEMSALLLLGYVSAYVLGWIIGRTLFPGYEFDPFIPTIGITGETSVPRTAVSMDHTDILIMFNTILDIPKDFGLEII